MASTQEIEEWTRSKPSLVQLRESARVDRAKLGAIPGNNSPDHRNAYLEQLRVYRLLVEQQQTLRSDVQNLLQKQLTLRKSLMQNLRKTRSPSRR
jgi:hypothetical protein